MPSKSTLTSAWPPTANIDRLYLKAIINSSPDPIIRATPGGEIDGWNRAAEKLFGYSRAEVMGRPITTLASPAHADLVNRVMRKSRRGKRTNQIEVLCKAKDKRQIDVALTISPVRDAGGDIVHFVVIARDITRRKEGRAARERQHRELLTLHRISEIVLSPRTLQESYRSIVDEICAATGFPAAAIALYDEPRGMMIFEGLRSSTRRAYHQSVEIPVSETLSSIVVKTGQPLIETHLLERVHHKSKIMGWVKAQTFVGYPMKAGGRIIGCLNLAHRKSIEVTPDMLSWIESLANYVAMLTEHKRSEEELRQSREQLRELSKHIQSVSEEERKRVAREVHDELGQELSLLQLDLGLLVEGFPGSATGLRQRARSMSKLIDSLIRSVQRISSDLRPTLLDNLGLGAAVDWAIRDFQGRTKIRCDLSIKPQDLKLDQDQSTALFRILQEALTNVLRHARATRVRVSLVKNTNSVILSVRDNGKGISALRVNDSKSVGLTGMRERMLPWYGNVLITGRAGKGTDVIVTLPLNP